MEQSEAAARALLGVKETATREDLRRALRDRLAQSGHGLDPVPDNLVLTAAYELLQRRTTSVGLPKALPQEVLDFPTQSS